MDLKIRKLAVAKHFILKSILDIIYNDNSTEYEDFLLSWADNFKVLSELLNVDIEVKDLIHKKYDHDKAISSYLLSTLEEDKLAKRIYETFGVELSIYYYFLSTLFALQYISSFYLYGDILMMTPKNRKKLMRSELKKGDEFVQSFFELFSTSNVVLNRYLSPEIIILLEKLSAEKNNSPFDYIKIHEISSEIVEILLPDYSDITYNLTKTKELINKITNCKPGLAMWQTYEKIGIETLRYLLFPEFDTIYFHKRIENGHQIRDAIVPNTQHFGFWNHIKNEFSSKNIIIEFKNGIQKSVEKNALNQLRIYLSKKTIGKFGLLFIRRKPSKSLLIARKLAYEESGILILLIDDTLLKRLLICKALMGSCNELLQKEKIKFEIEY